MDSINCYLCEDCGCNLLVVIVLGPFLHVNFAFLFNAKPSPRLVNIEKRC